MKSRMTTMGAAMATTAMLGSLIAPGAAHAGSKGRKNTAIGLGAAAAQQLLTGKTTNGVLLGAGAAYAYKRYQDARKDETRQRRTATYRRTNTGNRTVTRTSRSRYGAASPIRTNAPAGSFYFTGTVLDDTSELTNRNITVNHSGVSRRVYVPKSAAVLHAGERMSMHELKEGDVVRVLAVRGEDKWTASRVELLNAVDADEAVRNRDRFGDPVARTPTSTTRRGGSDLDTRRGTARYNGVGIVQRISEDGSRVEIRAGQNVRTVFLDGATFQGVSTVNDLREGDRVRVTGTLDGTDVNADQVVLLN
jgi:Cu/Ag efflux protein CusF